MSIEEQIETTLQKIRPFLHQDGGDIEFVRFEAGIVYVKMLGACSDCLYQDNTIVEGVAMLLTDEIPEVIEVKVVPAN